MLTTSELVGWLFVLGAAGLSYWHWRTASTLLDPSVPVGTRLSGWLTVGLAVTSIQGLAQSAPLIGAAAPPPGRQVMVQLIVVSVLCVLTALSERVDTPGDPALVGVGGGLLLTGLTFAVMVLAPLPPLHGTIASALATTAALGGLLLAWLVLQRRQAPIGARRRLAFVAVALTGSQVVSHLHQPDSRLVVLAVVGNLAGAVTLCVMTQTLLRRSFAQHVREVAAIKADLDAARSSHLHGRELMHEVSSTIAGIANATRMMRRVDDVSPDRRERLEAMLNAELARLQRLMSAEALDVESDLEVDEVVEQIVLSHQARGRDVRWEPCGLSATGNPDDLAEALNVLLENAARHASGATVHVSATVSDGAVALEVRDDGPGIDESVLPRLFASGARSEHSVGQGLGLAIARRLMVEADGSLELTQTGPAGTTFVIRLPHIEVQRAHIVAA